MGVGETTQIQVRRAFQRHFEDGAIIFDEGDHILDSTVLIDNFRWELDEVTGPITVERAPGSGIQRPVKKPTTPLVQGS